MIIIGKHQAGNRNVIQEIVEPVFLEKNIRLFGRFDGIGCQQTLIEHMVRCQHRLATEQHVKEFQGLDVAPDHQQANRQRRCENQPDWPPKCRPERRRGNDGKRRQPRHLAKEKRLQNLTDGDFDHQNNPRSDEGQGPAIADCGRDDNGKHG